MATIYAFIWAASGAPCNAANAVYQSSCTLFPAPARMFGTLLLLASHVLCDVLSFSLQTRDGP